MPELKCDLIVNAGGASRRMGADKALLKAPPDGTPLIRTVIERLAGSVSGETFVIANDPALASKAGLPLHVQVVPDDYAGAGALGGLATGLVCCSGWAIAVACDMPLVDPRHFAAFAELVELPGEDPGADTDHQLDAIVPRCFGRPQPLHALYHRRCLPAIETLLENGGRRFIHFYEAVRVRYVDESILRQIDPELHSFLNVNTPDDWQRAIELMQ